MSPFWFSTRLHATRGIGTLADFSGSVSILTLTESAVRGATGISSSEEMKQANPDLTENVQTGQMICRPTILHVSGLDFNHSNSLSLEENKTPLLPYFGLPPFHLPLFPLPPLLRLPLFLFRPPAILSIVPKPRLFFPSLLCRTASPQTPLPKTLR